MLESNILFFFLFQYAFWLRFSSKDGGQWHQHLAVESTLLHIPTQSGKSYQLNIYIVSTTYRYSFCKQMIIDKCIHPFSTFDQKSFYRCWQMIKRIKKLYGMKISASKYIVVPWCGNWRSYRLGAKDPIAPLDLGKRPELHPWSLSISFKIFIIEAIVPLLNGSLEKLLQTIENYWDVKCH